MKKLMKCISAALAIALILSITACTTSTPPASQAPQSSAPAAQASQSSAPAAQAPANDGTVYTLKFAVSWVNGNVNWPRAEIFKEKIETLTDGRLIIDIVGGADVFPATETVEAVMQGVIDGAYTSSGYSANYIPEIDAIAVSNMKFNEIVASGGVDLLNEYLAPNNLVFLMNFNEIDYTPFMIYLIDPITKLDELKGKKIRSSPGFWNEIISGIGATPVPLGLNEVFSALEQGMIEGFTAPSFIGGGEGFFEYAKYQLNPGFLRPGGCIVVNNDSWGKLPEDLRKLVLDNLDDIATAVDEDYDKLISESNFAKLEEAGGSAIQLSAEDSATLQKVAQDAAWDAIAAKVDAEKVAALKAKFMK